MGLRATLLILLVLPSLAAASPTITAQLDAQSLHATGADALGGLVVLTRGQAGGTATTDPTFTITAQAVHTRTYLLNPAVVNVFPVYRAPDREDHNYTGATITGLTNRPDYQFAVFTQGATYQATGCLDVAPSTQDSVQRWSQVYDTREADSTMSADTSTAVTWSACAVGNLVVKGSFVVMLWQWDSQLQAGPDTVQLPSGMSRYQYDPVGSPETMQVASEQRQVYLYVHDGELTMPLGNDATSRLYAAGAAGQATALTAEHARGALALGTRTVPVSDQTVAAGPSMFQLAAHARQLNAGLASGSFAVDGQPVALPSGGNALWPWLGALGLVAAPAVAVPVLLRRRTLRPSQELRIEALLGAGRTLDALELSRDLIKHSHNGRARLLHARVLAHAGCLEDAHDQYSWVARQNLDAATAAENAFQAACVAARLHQQARGNDRAAWHDHAMTWLQECARLKPDLVSDIGMVAELEPFVAELWPAQADS